MSPGDLVYIMGDPSRPILGTHPDPHDFGTSRTETITHGTPALVLEVDILDHGATVYALVLVQGMTLWVPGGFVKATNEEG